MEQYRTDDPLLAPGVAPSKVHRPADAAELVELVKAANRDGAKLIPVSSAAPHHRGGISCGAPHEMVDLSGWKKISHVDRRNRVCMIEPGVTYGELLAALAPHGLTASVPLRPRAGKSVVAAVMDREPATWPNKQWDIADPVAGTEFIFGSGETFRTGAAGGPGTLEQQRAVGGAQKGPMGPSQTDFQRVVGGGQGAMGIVTWITLRCEIKPTIEEPRLIGSDGLAALAEYVYPLLRSILGEQCFILDRRGLALLMGKDLPGLPGWVALTNFAGFDRLPRERVDYQLADGADLARRAGLQLSEALGGLTAREVLARALPPGEERDFRRGPAGHCLSLFFLTTLDRAPGFIESFTALAGRHGAGRDDFGVYLQPVVQNHGCHLEFMVPYDGTDGAAVERMKKLEAAAVEALMKAGAFFSRPYGAAAVRAFAANPLSYEVLKKVKAVFDPASVLAPGRFGLGR